MKTFDQAFEEAAREASPDPQVGDLTYHNIRNGHNEAFQNEKWKDFMEQMASSLLAEFTETITNEDLTDKQLYKLMMVSALSNLDAMFQLGVTIGIKMSTPEYASQASVK